MTQKVTPWEVGDSIDYDKLIKEFGVQKITSEQREYLKILARKKGLDEHIFLKRELFFAQMDLQKIIEAHKRGEPIFLYTGRSPGGAMHIGHLVPFMFTKYLQDLFDCNLYIQIPDDEKFLFKKELTLKEVQEMAISDIADICAIGFNPEKTFLFKNSEYIRNMYPILLTLQKKITFSQVRNTFGFTESTNIGCITYPALQMIPTFFENGYCLIPCAIDQNPYFLLQRDYAEKLGFKKNVTILSKFLTPLTGPEGKMSASNPESAILLTDNPKTIKNKVNKYAFSGGQPTLEEHRKLGGNPNIDVAYLWQYFLFEENDVEIKRINDEYKA
jgi:tryptophanyl-tRNA synthetase